MSRSKAIKAKCIDCIYDPLDKGTNLAQIERCTMLDCPLYPYRPIPQGSKTERGSKTQAQLASLVKAREVKNANKQ